MMVFLQNVTMLHPKTSSRPAAYHVVPEGASHQRLRLLTEVKAVGAEVGPVRAAILWKSQREHVRTRCKDVFTTILCFLLNLCSR